MDVPAIGPKRVRYLVPPVKFALVHLSKPFDLAAVAQTAIATGHVEIDFVGSTLGLDHPKVDRKVASWNVDPESANKIATRRFDSIKELRANSPNSRIIGTTVEGGHNPFNFDWQDDDIIVIGGANGLSKHDVESMDELITIPTTPDTSFLTVSTVVPVLTYYILNQRMLFTES